MSKFTDSLSSVIRGGDSDDVLGYIFLEKMDFSPIFRIFNAKISKKSHLLSVKCQLNQINCFFAEKQTC